MALYRLLKVLQPTGLFGVSALVVRDFFYVNMAKTWLEAQSYCREKHTDLATVDNMREMKTLINQVDPLYLGDVWIGLRKGAATHWGWSMGDDTVQQYSAFNATSSTFFINGSCGSINQDGYWYSLNCFSLQRFICYDEYSQVIYSLPYKFTWREAQAHCRLKYTDLVGIHNADEQQTVLSLVSTEYVWIGLFSDDWKWSDEATSFFRYWGSGKPLRLFNISNCVVMQMNDNGMWDDSLCDRKLPFMCYEVTTPKEKQVVKIKVRSQRMTDLNDPSVKANILNKIEEMLTRKRMINYTLSWREKDGIVFHPESDNVQQKNMSDEL
ncbi:macrophage mannose receptor 1-like [Pangasianodon hypophthalmus]|uniref:macrophage mannose receptor 1-like n=1 Tax=Pangasianodon hypophthalmus TaxID=310915 RepID=UPI002308368E|nr:macrophage mannose receptor 1-like [Pangasianodon hypophthalmus]